MKKLIFLLLLISGIFGSQLQAQYVTIPDANFVAFLQATYPQCMQGNQMDTTCTAIVTATTVTCINKNISDLSGCYRFVLSYQTAV